MKKMQTKIVLQALLPGALMHVESDNDEHLVEAFNKGYKEACAKLHMPVPPEFKKVKHIREYIESGDSPFQGYKLEMIAMPERELPEGLEDLVGLLGALLGSRMRH